MVVIEERCTLTKALCALLVSKSGDLGNQHSCSLRSELRWSSVNIILFLLKASSILFFQKFIQETLTMFSYSDFNAMSVLCGTWGFLLTSNSNIQSHVLSPLVVRPSTVCTWLFVQLSARELISTLLFWNTNITMILTADYCIVLYVSTFWDPGQG